MAYCDNIRASCDNKLCDYKGTVMIVNGHRPAEKSVCPECGFKTLNHGVSAACFNELAKYSTSEAFDDQMRAFF